MKHFQFLGDTDVAPLLAQIYANPNLWDQHSMRRIGEATPHAAMRDIWVRWNDIEKCPDRESFNELHMPVMYPAWNALPELRPIVFDIMRMVEAVHLGAVLITKIPPGGKILPHTDGGWHAEYHNCKVYVPLQANPACVNYCGGDSQVMGPGEVWTFNNLIEHSVDNDGETDRITLIICMRVES